MRTFRAPVLNLFTRTDLLEARRSVIARRPVGPQHAGSSEIQAQELSSVAD